jgi:hypothetical protein
MAELEHFAREFEKVHDSLPKMEVRIAVVEEWQKSHPDTHRLEGVALELARKATDIRLESMNELRNQISEERGTFVTRELYDREAQRIREELNNLRASRDSSSGEKGLLEKFWPLFLALAMFVAGHFWK